MNSQRLVAFFTAACCTAIGAMTSQALPPDFLLSAVRFQGAGVGSLDQFDASGNLIRTIPISGFPQNVTMDVFGNSYVIVYSPSSMTWQVNKYGQFGQPLGAIVPPTTEALLGLGVDQFRLYVGYNSTIDSVSRFQLDGSPLGVFATVSMPAPGAPFALEFDAAHGLYVPDNFDIERFGTAGQSLGIFASLPNNGPESFATDLAFDVQGNLFAETLDNKIYVFNSSGAQTDVLNLPGSTGSAFDIDSENTLYVTDGSGILKYGSAGAALGTFVADGPGEYFDIAVFQSEPEPASITSFVVGSAFLVGLKRRRSSLKRINAVWRSQIDGTRWRG